MGLVHTEEGGRQWAALYTGSIGGGSQSPRIWLHYMNITTSRQGSDANFTTVYHLYGIGEEHIWTVLDVNWYPK